MRISLLMHRFVLMFYPLDNTIAIYEPKQPNSGLKVRSSRPLPIVISAFCSALIILLSIVGSPAVLMPRRW